MHPPIALVVLGFGVCSIMACCGRPDGLRAALDAGHDPLTIEFNMDDPRVQAAVREARATVGQFQKAVESSEATGAQCAFLTDFEENGVRSHVWVQADPHSVTPGKLSGSIIETPKAWHYLRAGQGVVQEPNLVTDWRIIQHGRIDGAFTTHLLVKCMTESERHDLERRLGVSFEGTGTGGH
jgi:uncharacterized protein YegJ (DUF2314 family)